MSLVFHIVEFVWEATFPHTWKTQVLACWLSTSTCACAFCEDYHSLGIIDKFLSGICNFCIKQFV